MSKDFSWDNPFTGEDIGAAWCSPENAHKEMDSVLGMEILRLINARFREILKAQGILLYNRILPTGEHERWSAYKFHETTCSGILIDVKEIGK